MRVAKIYRIRENFHPDFLKKTELDDYQKSVLDENLKVESNTEFHFPKKKGTGSLCFLARKTMVAEGGYDYHFETSYFVGAQWLVKDKFPVLVEPKFNVCKEDKAEIEVDYIKLMVEALEPSENAEHLSDLVSIDFEQPQIEIEQQDDLLSPLLIIQYMHLLKSIVKKGLKNSYYRTTKNLKSRVQGKVLVSDTVKQNHVKSRMLQTVCSFDEFGVDHDENRLLKKAFQFSTNYLEKIRSTNSNFDKIDEIGRYIRPAFQNVSDDVNIKTIKQFKTNPLFKEYGEALKLAKQILQRFGFNITQTVEEKVKTPPFWIDMSKLFELHVLKLLKEKFPAHGEVLYQENIDGYYPDYLLKSKCGSVKMVVDAKYKNYNVKNLNIDDVRQISGYARMENVYRTLKKDDNEVIDCLVIYPNTKSKHQNFKEVDFQNILERESNYRNMFKLDILLPLI